MNPEAARKLREIISEYGPALWEDARRFEALLKDLCPHHDREIFLFTCAVRQRVHKDLLSSQNSQPLEVVLARAARRLSAYLFLAEDAARWTVDSVAVAAGVASEAEIVRLRQAQARTVVRPLTRPITKPSLPTKATLPPTVSHASTPPASRQARRSNRWPTLLLRLFLFSACSILIFHTPTRTACAEWLGELAIKAYSLDTPSVSRTLYAMAHSMDPVNPEWSLCREAVQLIEQHRQNLGPRTTKEEWKRLGDAYKAMREEEQARAHHGVARLLDPVDPSLGPVPGGLTPAISLLKSIGILDDEWIGDRGDAALRLSYTVEALEIYRWALSADPTDFEWAKRKDQLMILEQWREAVRHNIKEDEHWGDLGDAYRVVGLQQKAESCYAIARLIQPDDYEWQQRNPRLSSAVVMLDEFDVRDDEWIGDLGEVARTLGDLYAAEGLHLRTLFEKTRGNR